MIGSLGIRLKLSKKLMIAPSIAPKKTGISIALILVLSGVLVTVSAEGFGEVSFFIRFRFFHLSVGILFCGFFLVCHFLPKQKYYLIIN